MPLPRAMPAFIIVGMTVLMVGMTIACGTEALQPTAVEPTIPFTASAQPTITPTPVPEPTATPLPVGFTRSNPAPYGTWVAHDDIAVIVRDVIYADEVTRGCRLVPNELTDRNIYPINWRDPVDREDHKGMWIKVILRNLLSKNESKRYSYRDFRLTGVRGLIYESDYPMLKGGYLADGEFFGSAIAVGWIIQQYHRSDSSLMLMYSPSSGGTSYYSPDSPPR